MFTPKNELFSLHNSMFVCKNKMLSHNNEMIFLVISSSCFFLNNEMFFHGVNGRFFPDKLFPHKQQITRYFSCRVEFFFLLIIECFLVYEKTLSHNNESFSCSKQFLFFITTNPRMFTPNSELFC